LHPPENAGAGGEITEVGDILDPFVAVGGELARQVTLGAPLQSAERRLGTLVVSRTNGDDFGTYEVRLLRAFGSQASMLLERSLLYEEIAAGAILQERSRLAREIHDGLAQHLAFLKMRVAWLQRSRSDMPELGDIEGVLETALVEARHAISTLRSEPQGTSTVDAIAQYAEEFSQVSGLEVEVDGDEQLPVVGPKVRVELLRVVQEALNNVRKHAQASHIDLDIRAVQGGMRIAITDNGAGFDTERSAQGHFGLEIMKERTESVGGEFGISSTPHVGTEVHVWMPGRELEAENGHHP
jgi:two-component system nitrate/nitrite sensor histidine kinase NarX